MKKRTDRKIAIAGTAAAAVLLPTVMVGLAQAGIGVPTGKSEASGNSQTIPSFGPATQPSAPAGPASPGAPPKTAKLPSVPLGTNPFKTGGGSPAPGNPDTDNGSHGKKPQLPPGTGSSKYAKAPDGAAITEVKKVTSRTFDVTIASPALGAAVKTRVMIPKGWKSTATKSWPVVYAYHGGNNNYTSWTKDSNIEQIIGPYDAMVVMPEGGWNGSYTNWWNGGKGGIPEWETFHIEEVIPLMERNFHAGSVRAAIGLSSGGQGAITYAERHPGKFKYAASYSGALNITAPGMPVILTSMNRQAGTAIWGDPLTARANWRAHDAAVNVAKLKGIGVYVSSGNGEPGPYDKPETPPLDAGRIGEQLAGTMNDNFVAAAKNAGVPVTSHLYGPGMHNWKYWKRELAASWPKIAASIGARKS
ncbi:alpha/beta hydrolase [Actinomadura latina]|uniref:Esterase family protein n=1 Tax=Actinomadura latina TaxID=163603 RepID=A0A846YUZ1_9ACTN|nr:alpha/beta hydrolase family protein [Actinomadura latina]NKZ04710.1 esterase family protein [Actinomadura latina]